MADAIGEILPKQVLEEQVDAALGCAAGGVKYGRKLGPWGAAIEEELGAVVCGYLAYTATS